MVVSKRRVTWPRGLEGDQALPEELQAEEEGLMRAGRLEGARNAKESCGGMRMREWTLRGLPKD